MGKKLKKYFCLVFQTFLYLVSFFVPKNKSIWIYGSWTGNTFSDNPKYLYLYMRENHPEIRSVYICKNKKTVERLKRNRMEACYYYSFRACMLAMRAKVAFLTAAHCDVNSFCCARIQYIQLFHGTQIKKTYLDDNLNRVPVSKLKQYIVRNILKYLDSISREDYVTISSENVAFSYLSAFGTTWDKLLVTGLARTDAYIRPPANKYILELKERLNSPLITYLPTHRNNGKHENTGMGVIENAQFINELLSVENLYMIYKPHYNESENLEEVKNRYSHIIIPDDEECMEDVYAFTGLCDLLITDYSSIYVDYLLTDRPIVFFPYDLSNYLSGERQLYYDYFQITPGPKCYTWEDTIRQSARLLKNDDTKIQREKICNFFNRYPNGNACERIYCEVCKIIGR